jgi:hypothetical protein
VGGDHHVGGLRLERLVDDAGIVLRQAIDIHAARLRLLHLGLRAQVRPGGVVELQIAAAGIIEALHGLGVGGTEVVEDVVVVLVWGADGVRLEAEMQHARARDRHLRRDARVGLEEPEVLQHRMVGEAELAGDADALRLGLDALELDAVVELVDLDVVEHAEEIEMPPGAAKLAVARELEPDLLLLGDDVADLAILDLLELTRGDLAFLALGAGILERRGTQEAADVVGTVGRDGPVHRAISLLIGSVAPPVFMGVFSPNEAGIGTCVNPKTRWGVMGLVPPVA